MSTISPVEGFTFSSLRWMPSDRNGNQGSSALGTNLLATGRAPPGADAALRRAGFFAATSGHRRRSPGGGRAQQERGQGRRQEDRAERVHQEHESEQHAHVGL